MNPFFVARQRCPGCGCERSRELCRTPYDTDPIHAYLGSFYAPQGGVEFEYLRGQDYILNECADCGLVYQPEIPDEALSHRLYEQWIDPAKCFARYECSRGIDYFERLCREIVQIVRYFACPPMELAMLDYSMGWGHWCRIAQSFGCRVHGTEFSRSRVAYARGRGVHVIEVAQIAEYRYDFINTEQVFEHLPDPCSVLAYLKASLKPGGLLKISVPDGWDIRRRLACWDWSAPKGSAHSLNPVAPLEPPPAAPQ